MILLSELFSAFLTALFLENLLFARAFDIPGLYQKHAPSQILKIGAILTGIVTVSAVPAYFFNKLLKEHANLSAFSTLGFLCINCIVFLCFYYALDHFFPAFFESVKKSLPFYGVNCVTLGTLLVTARMSVSAKLITFLGYSFGSGVGFTLALLIIWSIRQPLSMSRIPKVFRGLPITFIYLGIVSLALFGLLGNQLPA